MIVISFGDPRNDDHDAPECIPQGEVTLDITVGKLFPEGDLEERQRANEENVHA